MKRLYCECCGANLPLPERYQKYIKCNYCSAVYEIENNFNSNNSITSFTENIKYTLIEPGNVRKIKSIIEIDEGIVRQCDKEQITAYVKEQLANQIAELLINYITIYENFDIVNFKKQYAGILKIWIDK